METAGIKELKNRLTHYIRLVKGGDKLIVTDRGAPVATLRGIDETDERTGTEDRLASLAKGGLIRLPLHSGKLPARKPIRSKGKPASELIIEDRR